MYSPFTDISSEIPSNGCCDTLEVYYGTPTKEYTYTNIYGYYEKQSDNINGRSWYKNSEIGKSIWWWAEPEKHQHTSWMIGDTIGRGKAGSFGYLKRSEICLPNIIGANWKLWDALDASEPIDAGAKLKIRCS